MKIKAYLQISKTGILKISRKPQKQPIHNNCYGIHRKFYPTIQYVLNITLDDKIFNTAEQELNLSLQRPDILNQIDIKEKEQ
jgi:hypothetical protein